MSLQQCYLPRYRNLWIQFSALFGCVLWSRPAPSRMCNTHVHTRLHRQTKHTFDRIPRSGKAPSCTCCLLRSSSVTD